MLDMMTESTKSSAKNNRYSSNPRSSSASKFFNKSIHSASSVAGDQALNIGNIEQDRQFNHQIYDIKNEIGQCSFTRNS